MKAIRLAAASGLVLAFALSSPAIFAEQDIQGPQNQNQREHSAMPTTGSSMSGTASGGGMSGSMQGTGNTTAGGMQQSNSITTTADDLEDAKVVDSQGNKVGEIEELVRKNQDGKTYAVISVGGFFDIGGKDIVVPLDELSMKDDKVVLPQGLDSKEQLKQRPTYDESKYSELGEDEQVQVQRSDFAAFEGQGQGQGQSQSQSQSQGTRY